MELFDRFLQERTYLKGVSPETLRYYRWVRRAFLPILTQPTKTAMMERIQAMLAEGISPVSVNTYLRGFRAYINWLHQEGHLKEVFKVQMLKTEQKVIQALSSEMVNRILKFSPQTTNDRRIHVFICLLLDSGIRLSEALALRKDDIDFDNMVLKIHGKGNKQRLVPISVEGRKIIYKFSSRQKEAFLFGTRNGNTISKRNADRDMKVLGRKLNITGVRFSPHTLRHTFACEYLRRGGNLEFLRRILGHNSILTTQKYLRSLGVQDLQAVHNGLTLLSATH
jgi:site-specific recombinase XerD